MTDPIKIFIGTEPRMWLGVGVLKHSIEKLSSMPVEVHEMNYSEDDPTWHDWDMGRPHHEPCTRAINEKGNYVWFTDFTNFRWAIPEKCGFEGRAIYNDFDQIYTRDPKELWDLDMGGKPILTLTLYESSVMLFDCAKFKDLEWWPSIEEMKTNGWGIRQYCQLLFKKDVFGQLPPRWNCLDGRLGTPWIEGLTGCVHYTDMSGQINRPYPEALNYHRHQLPRLEEIWMDCYYNMEEEGKMPSPCTMELPIANPDDPDVMKAFQNFRNVWEIEGDSRGRIGPNLYTQS